MAGKSNKPKVPRPFSNKGFYEDDCIALSWDTETNGLGGELLFISACSMDCDDLTYSGADMVHRFITMASHYPKPFVWYAHNAQYDWRYLLDYIRENAIPCDISMRTDTDIYQIKLFIDGSQIIFRDSLAVFPGTLRQFAETFTPELPKGDIDFEAGEIFDPANPDHVAYAIRDAQILRKGIPRFNGMLSRHFGITLAHTTAGTAMKAWQASLPDGRYYDASVYGEDEEFIRSGYYGGLVFLTRTDEIKNAVTFDINSSYPYQMETHGVPYGQRMSTRQWRGDYLGIFKVKVRTPPGLIIPILPHRDDKGYMRWHQGTFVTTVTNLELKFAESHGYEILECYEGFAWEETVFPFGDFIGKCKAIRFAYPGMSEEAIAKLMQNSLYGKYGSRRERQSVFCIEGDDEVSTIGAIPIDDAGYWWSRTEFSEDLRCIPEWAVFITANARMHLLRTVYSVGPENCLYGDTDSLTVLPGNDHHFDTGLKYGQWKKEKVWKRFRAIAPKVYAGELDDGRLKGAAKGLPRKKMGEPQWNELLQGNRITVDYQTLPSLRVAMARGVEPAHDISRISTDINNAGNWELHGVHVRPKFTTQTEEPT